VFAHGRTFHDGGWFDTSGGKPQIQVRTEPSGPWQTVSTLTAYPNTTATDDAGLTHTSIFELEVDDVAPEFAAGPDVTLAPAAA